MANSNPFTSHSLFLTIFFNLIISFNCSSSSSPIASDQLRFWSKNVLNKMPKSISTKLSPLTKTQSDYYTNLISTNDRFSADSRFCSLARLACRSQFEDSKPVKESYSVEKTYAKSANFDQEKFKNEDPFSFFRLSILKKGKIIHLPNLDDSLPFRSFLPSQIASKISLTEERITKLFPQSGFGYTKETIENTLSYCNASAIKGETKSCPKSLDEMIGFVKSVLGKKYIISFTSKNNKGSNSEVLIKKIEKFESKKIVACHEAFLPFAAYFCHSLSSTFLYSVELVDPKTGFEVNKMIGICHMDTSPWPKNHVAFYILKFGPGQGEACHWFTQLDLAWISAN